MTTSGPEGTKRAARRAWNLGVRARLLIAFLAIAGFAVLAAAAGFYAFREVGGRLDLIDMRVPPTLSALELSRSAERIIAAAPALLAARDPTQRDEVKAELALEVERLNDGLVELKRAGTQPLPLEEIERIVSALTASLGELDGLVARRLATRERIGAWRRDIFRTRAELQRLLAPWLEVTEMEIAAAVEGVQRAGSDERSSVGQRLASLIQAQRTTRAAQQQAFATVDMLTEASTTEEARRLPVLNFQLGLALRNLGESADRLDPQLRPLFLEQVSKLREFADGPKAMAEARSQELALVGEGERRLAEAASLSTELTGAVDRLGSAAKQDIGDAIRDALRVQHLSGRTLVALVALSLLTAVLIVWFYVGGNIVRRLTALSDGMLAIAGGKLRAPVGVQGTDEIAAMAQAVEVFRHNTLERDALLAEKARTADLLEEEVRQRTAEVEEKRRQLESANEYKSHFLASASHDLRQPLHALNLFVAQLRTESDFAERDRLVQRIDSAVNSMNALFELLLDMSKLEAGILEPQFSAFPIERAFERIETTFADIAKRKGLRLSVVSSEAWVRTDLVLLERILMNLVSNAVRYTARGGVVVGCRRRGEHLRIDVCDSGPGIPQEQQQSVFGEYYRLPAAKADRSGGLGLGLAIVDRLGRLLDHEVALQSRPGHGSRFSVSVPLTGRQAAAEALAPPAIADPVPGKLVVVIDDDPLVLEGMGGILQSWGCELLTAESEEAALSAVAAQQRRPDLIVSDYRLTNGTSGIQAIAALRREFGTAVPAFLISGDTAPERLRDAREHGIHLLHKPVSPMRLRAMINQLLKARRAATVPAAE